MEDATSLTPPSLQSCYTVSSPSETSAQVSNVMDFALWQTFLNYDFRDINSAFILLRYHLYSAKRRKLNGPRQANLVLIAYASSEGSGEPAHPRSLTRTSAARSYKQ